MSLKITFKNNKKVPNISMKKIEPGAHCNFSRKLRRLGPRGGLDMKRPSRELRYCHLSLFTHFCSVNIPPRACWRDAAHRFSLDSPVSLLACSAAWWQRWRALICALLSTHPLFPTVLSWAKYKSSNSSPCEPQQTEAGIHYVLIVFTFSACCFWIMLTQLKGTSPDYLCYS